ncbi:hypothetical protein FK535_19320 [Mycolicibacterium sp. 018/SC-01/001]|uniref:lipase family protein n=1 Tax=Mycolicibacterium sp. 018/SC-01/001 TaxID=2592069 RepID=UPI001180C70D|nr:lipase family protein [Mycolicibacterium sp. 018/SC-01/001]TRW80494.1 hypothetical protein FK535_19320 [Mycolicibacterium sp. 018/SC-01/001]
MKQVASDRRRPPAAVFWLALVMLAVAACTPVSGVTRVDTDPTAKRHFQGDPSTAAPGTLLSSSPDPTVDVRINRAHASATRISFRSTDGTTGRATSVTGVVFTPQAAPPPQGWLVVAFGPPVAGISADCAPSQHPDLLGNGATVEFLLQQGYLVVMPDYQREGSTGHPYLEPTSMGYNMIDAVRAARQLAPGAGDRWAAYGIAEGGEAAWAAAELAPAYGQGLTLVASATLDPTVDLSALPALALTDGLDPEQRWTMLYAANALSQQVGDFRLDDYVRGSARQNNALLISCGDLRDRATVGARISPADIRPADTVAAQRMSDVLRARSLSGQFPAAQVPILVIVGAADPAVRTDWTAAVVQSACARGEQITYVYRVGEGRDDLNQRPALTWLAHQFTGGAVEQSGRPADGTRCNGS